MIRSSISREGGWFMRAWYGLAGLQERFCKREGIDANARVSQRDRQCAKVMSTGFASRNYLVAGENLGSPLRG
jgi:hypothetical protein